VYDLAEIGCEGVIIGKAIYEGRITLKELTKINQDTPVVKAKDSGGSK
jgi:phosphoribosylformimino-5-aminoimidazole carboxamide ribotide isomerase